MNTDEIRKKFDDWSFVDLKAHLYDALNEIDRLEGGFPARVALHAIEQRTLKAVWKEIQTKPKRQGPLGAELVFLVDVKQAIDSVGKK